MLSVPNSLFLSHTVINESALDHYTLHLFTIPMKIYEDWQTARKLLLKLANEACEPYLDSARTYLDKMSRKEGFDSPDSSPRVNVHISAADEIEFMVRIPAPAANRGRVEQAIKQGFLRSFRYTQPHIKE